MVSVARVLHTEYRVSQSVARWIGVSQSVAGVPQSDVRVQHTEHREVDLTMVIHMDSTRRDTLFRTDLQICKVRFNRVGIFTADSSYTL